MAYRIRGLDPEQFADLFGQPDDALAAAGISRHLVDRAGAFPDRVELRDLAIGETALLLNFEHQPAPTPYRSSHAIYVREGATQAADLRNELPDVIRRRVISLRAFDAAGHMIDAHLGPGSELEPAIDRLFADPAVAYLHAHYATRGCYAALITRS